MAVALSLLIVLPTLAQVSGDRTDGRQSVGSWLDVRVADNLDDIAAGETTIGTATFRAENFDARDTYFNGDLYISNDVDAFNTILISAAVADDDLADNDVTATEDVEGPCAANVSAGVAKIKNDRSGTTVTAYLVDTNRNETTGAAAGRNIVQGLAVVWDQEDSIESHNALCSHDDATGLPNHGDAMKFVDDDEDVTNNPEDGWTLASAAVIPARDGDTLTVTVKGVSGSIKLVVDGDEPEIEDIAPAGGGITNSNNVDLGFTISDDGSGIRYDGESGASGDVDLQPHNGDGDQRFDEPLTTDPVETQGEQIGHNGNGSTMDIQVYFAGDKESTVEDDGNSFFDVGDESSAYGSNHWAQRSKGVEYALDMRLTGNEFGTYYWQVTAKDRVGNSVTTDGDEETSGDQPYSFKVDDAKPMVGSARTGIGYKAAKGEFKDRSWIALNFVNEPDEDQPQTGGADRIDSSTVQVSDFTVEGHTVMSVLVPSDKETCKGDVVRSGPYTVTDDEGITSEEFYLGTEDDESAKNIKAFDADDKAGSDLVAPANDDSAQDGTETSTRGEAEVKIAKGCAFEPRARVYLQLTEALDSDAEPTIQLLGGVLRDIAGNNNITQQIDAEDKIAPGVTISIVSSSETSNRAATDNDGSFTVRVEADEELSKFPRLFFATLQYGKITNGVADDLTIADVTTGDGIFMNEEADNVWEKKVNADDANIPGIGNRIVALLVNATDEANPGNAGNSPGWSDNVTANGKPDADEDLDYGKLNTGGFLVEIDNLIEKAGIVVLPSIDPGTVDETESMNPYIQIDFEEADEYGIADAADADAADTDPGPTAFKAAIDDDGNSKSTDSHADVTITSLTLNGEDRLAEVVRVKASQYVLAVSGLAIGEYTIAYTAMDDVGNEYDDAEEFDFEVKERQPYDIVLNPGWNLISVPGDPFNPAVGSVIGDLRADTVLGYQGGEWVTAVKNEDGRWMGTLTDIRGGYGYWVRTSVVETIETVIPPVLPTAVLPTVPIVAGWNLVGVVDAEQRAMGEDAHFDADEYLTSLGNNWRVAYAYETQVNAWEKLLPAPKTDAQQYDVENGRGYWLWNTSPGTLVP